MNSTSILIELPSAPLTGNAAEHCVVNIENIIFTERKLRLVRLGVPIEADSNVERISRLVLDLIEF